MGIGFSTLFFATLLTLVAYLFVWMFRAFAKPGDTAKSGMVGKTIKEAIIIGGVFVASIFGLLFLAFRNEGSFEKYPGAGDYWRVPLQKPYQLSMIDGLETACLSVWEPNQSGFSCLIDGITRCAVKGPYLIGKSGREYFLFNQVDQRMISEASFDSLRAKTPVGLEIGETDLKTIRQFYKEHWR